jgi:hemerythrin
MLIWNEQFVTGSDTIDSQHRMLIDKINQLEMMLTDTNPTREGCEFVMHLVNFMESYAGTHFKFEEQCMESYRCPAHQKNKEEHERFLVSFHHFKERYVAEGFRLEVLQSLHQATSSWIQNHILRVDVQLRPCIKA